MRKYDPTNPEHVAKRRATNKRTLKIFGGLFAVIILIVIIGAAAGGGSKGSSSPSSGSTAAKQEARFWLVAHQSSCQESPAQAFVNCSVGVRNTGSVAGLPTVYVDYRYDDNGENIYSSQNAIDEGNSQPSDKIAPHRLGYVYFSHPYNARQHNLIQATASLDLNAKRWSYIGVADPSNPNWP